MIDDVEVADLQIAAEKLGIDILNTRCVDSPYISDLLHLTAMDSVEKQSSTAYVLHVASTQQCEVEHEVSVKGASATFKIQHGDFAEALQKVVSELEEVRARAIDSSFF